MYRYVTMCVSHIRVNVAQGYCLFFFFPLSTPLSLLHPFLPSSPLLCSLFFLNSSCLHCCQCIYSITGRKTGCEGDTYLILPPDIYSDLSPGLRGSHLHSAEV